MKIHRLALASILALTACAASDPASDDGAGRTSSTDQALSTFDSRGHVHALSNERAENAVLVFDRGSDGALTAAGRVPTGGLGSDDGLGSQGSLIRSEDGDWLMRPTRGAGQCPCSVSTTASRGSRARSRPGETGPSA